MSAFDGSIQDVCRMLARYWNEKGVVLSEKSFYLRAHDLICTLPLQAIQKNKMIMNIPNSSH